MYINTQKYCSAVEIRILAKKQQIALIFFIQHDQNALNLQYN